MFIISINILNIFNILDQNTDNTAMISVVS